VIWLFPGIRNRIRNIVISIILFIGILRNSDNFQTS